jgi:hypothetical protein
LSAVERRVCAARAPLGRAKTSGETSLKQRGNPRSARESDARARQRPNRAECFEPPPNHSPGSLPEHPRRQGAATRQARCPVPAGSWVGPPARSHRQPVAGAGWWG